MIKIAICDDESAQRTVLALSVDQWASSRGIVIQLREYESAEGFLFAADTDRQADILLLDIQMKGMDGVELARQLRGENEAAQIIFITAYPDFMAEGYEVSALHYLMKPVKQDKLFQVLDRAVDKLNRPERSMLVQTADETLRVPLRDIIFIEAFAHYVAIHTKASAMETRASISGIEKDLDDSFVRCHRSYLVGLRHISRIAKAEVLLDDGKIIPLSRRLYGQVNQAFIQYFKRELRD